MTRDESEDAEDFAKFQLPPSSGFGVRTIILSHKFVPEAHAVGLDQPRRRMWKMDRQNISAGASNLGEKLSPRSRGLRRIPVEDCRPIRLATLQGMVHEVANHDRLLSARADIDAAMVGRVAGRRLEPKRIVELIVVVDKQRLAGFDDRLAIVVKHIATSCGAGFAALGQFLPGGIFAFVKNILGFRKCRHPAAITQHRVPATMVDMEMRAEHIINVFKTQARAPQSHPARAVSESPSAADSLCPRRYMYR